MAMLTRGAKLDIRWMLYGDMREVLRIENAVFPHPWCETDFVRCLRRRNCIGMVVARDGHVLGYMVYELTANRLHLLSLAVDPREWRGGIGRAMVEALKRKLSPQRRWLIVTEVREPNLEAQLFFRSQGFRAVGIHRGWFGNGEDAYRFVWRLPT